jgi:hypothetical protein
MTNPPRPRIHEETDELLRECMHLARKKARSVEGRSEWETGQGKTTKDLVIRRALRSLLIELEAEVYDQ